MPQGRKKDAAIATLAIRAQALCFLLLERSSGNTSISHRTPVIQSVGMNDEG